MDDALELLRLQIEWGADEALGPQPVDRLRAATTASTPAAAPATPTPSARPPAGVAARAAVLAAECGDFDALTAALAAFDGCTLRDTAGQMAFADGPLSASLMLVIEAPDAEDDATGRPLSGRLGRFAEEMLRSIGVTREAVRIGCLVPWRPPGGRPPTPIEIAACRPFLEAHLRLLPDIRHLVLLGATVARTVTGAAGSLRQMRGGWLETRVADRVVPSLAMAPLETIIGDGRQKAGAWGDLLRLRRALDAAARVLPDS
jgi:DNA polymerase